MIDDPRTQLDDFARELERPGWGTELREALGKTLPLFRDAVMGLVLVLWRLPGRVDALRRRIRLRLVVRMVPQDVHSSDEIYRWLFDDVPKDAEHEHTRRSAVAILIKKVQASSGSAALADDRQARHDWLMLAELLDGLERYGDGVIGRMVSPSASARRAPPKAALAQIHGFLGGVPTAAIVKAPWLAMGLAVTSIMLALMVWGQHHAVGEAKAKLESSENEMNVHRRNAEASTAALARRDEIIEQERAAHASAAKQAETRITTLRRQAERDRALLASARMERARHDATPPQPNRERVPGRSDAEFLRDLGLESATTDTGTDASAATPSADVPPPGGVSTRAGDGAR